MSKIKYTYHCDGSCHNGAESNADKTMGLGFLYTQTDPDSPQDIERRLAVSAPVGSSNIAEYLAIICALYDFYILMGAKRSHEPYAEETTVTIHSDSQLVVRQIIGEYCARKVDMSKLLEEVDVMLDMLYPLKVKVLFKWVPRGAPEQQVADWLSKVGNPYFTNIVADDTVYYRIDNEGEYLKGPTPIAEMLQPEMYNRIKEKLQWKD